MTFKKIIFYPVSILIGLFIYYLLFRLNIINPDYSFGIPENCVDVINYQISDSSNFFKYPFSCDQEMYYSGFENFSVVISETYNYQARPLYILGGSIFYQLVNFILNILNIEFEYTTQVAIFLYQLLIVNSIVYILYKSLSRHVKISNFEYFSMLALVMINPIYKWGIFVPSHQTATLLLIAFFFYYSTINIPVNKNTALIFGLFFLFHRAFLISYLALVLYKNINNLLKRKTYIENTKLLFYFLLPNLVYESFIRFILERSTYDANTEYWGQFIWIFDFVRGKVRYESEWHCVTIPENFICYLTDFKKMIMYIAFPVLLIFSIYLLNYLLREHQSYLLIKESIFISVSLFAFWSLIGWYPPIRFNFYSIGHFATILLIIFLINEQKTINKALILLASFSAYIFIPHWNIPKIEIVIETYQVITIILLLSLVISKIYEKRNSQ